MAGTNKCSQWLPGDCYQIFLECNSLVAGKHRVSYTGLTITASYLNRHMTDFKSFRLALFHSTTELFECLKKKRLNVMRLQATGFALKEGVSDVPALPNS